MSARPLAPPAGGTLLGLLLLLSSSPAGATMQVERADAFKLAVDQTATNSLLVMADVAEVGGTLTDDLFLAARQFTLTGRCANDLWVAASESATLRGPVADHVRAVANKLSIENEIANGLLAAGNSVVLATNSLVRGGARVLADSATLAGRVEGAVHITAGQCTLSGTLAGPARIVASDIVVMPGTRIEGDLRYTAPEELVLDPRVELQGRLIREPLRPAAETALPWPVRLSGQVFLLLGALLSGLALMGVFPHFTGRAVLALRQAPARCGLAGALGFALLPMTALAAAFTVIGLPVGLLLAGLYGALLYLGKVVVALSLGARFFRWQGPQPFARAALALAAGLPVLYLAAALPLAGPVLRMLITLLGLGALLQALWRPAAGAPPPPLPPR